MADESNPHKQLAQLAKRDDLCAHIEQNCNDAKLHLFDNAADIVDMLDDWTQAIWDRVAASCSPGHDPPSVEVQELVKARFRSRLKLVDRPRVPFAFAANDRGRN